MNNKRTQKSENPRSLRNQNRSSRGVNKERNRERKGQAPTVGGASVAQTLLTTVPLFPVQKVVTGQIYYDYAKSLTGSTGAVPTGIYSANGMYDPDISGLGHQPMGFDTMMTYYEQYTVLRSHIKVTFASAGDHARVALYLNPDTTTNSVPKLVENGLTKIGTVNGPASSNGRYAYCTLELACDVPKYFGKTRSEIIADPQMYGTVAANPGEQVYFCVAAWAGFDSTVDVAVGYDVIVTYDVLYWEPRKVAPQFLPRGNRVRPPVESKAPPTTPGSARSERRSDRSVGDLSVWEFQDLKLSMAEPVCIVLPSPAGVG